MTIEEILAAWFWGRYRLGWRGHLALWLITGEVYDAVNRESRGEAAQT